jgi:hypothetical protein
MTRPKRLLLIYTSDGTADSESSAGPIDWQPQGTETDFTLHPIHSKLEPLKSKILVPWGLKMSAAGAGEQHAYGSAGMWTGARRGGSDAGDALPHRGARRPVRQPHQRHAPSTRATGVGLS